VAVEAAKIIISAKDETRAAFESIRGNFSLITGLASALGAGALATAVKQAANFADEMQESAEKVGLTTKALSELKYAADLNGDAFEALQVGIKRLSTTMLDFQDGNKGAQELFRRLGVEVVDASGKLRGSDAVLKDIADRFQELPNGAQKTALAMQLFGKSGADLIPLLNQGSEGFKRFADEAERFGLVVDDQAASAAAQFNDNIDRLGKAFEGFKIQAATTIIPALTEITEKMVEAIKQGGLLKGLLVGYGESFKSFMFGSTATNQAKRSDFGIPNEITRLQSQLKNDANGSNPLSNVDRFKIQQDIQALAREKNNLDRMLGRIKDTEDGSKPTRDTTLSIGNGSGSKDIGNAAFAKQSQELATLIQNFQKAAEGPRTQAEDLQKTLDTYRALNPEVQTYLQGLVDQVAQRELLTKETEAWQRQQELAADFDARELQAIEEVSAAEVAKTEAMERQALAIRELLDPQLKLLNMQQEYTALLDAGLLSQEEYASALDKLAESQKDLADNGKTSLDDLKRAVEGFGKDAASAFVDFAFTGKASFGDMVESILKDLARLAIQRSITDPLIKGLDDSGIFSNFADGFKNIFGGARAAGGPVASGKAYLVGERGPEIFMPSASGTIIPNGAGGGGMSVSVSVDASGSRAQGDGDQALAVGNAIGEAVRAELLRQRRPGGLLG
jgi:uncharacterized protein YqgQ